MIELKSVHKPSSGLESMEVGTRRSPRHQGERRRRDHGDVPLAQAPRRRGQVGPDRAAVRERDRPGRRARPDPRHRPAAVAHDLRAADARADRRGRDRHGLVHRPADRPDRRPLRVQQPLLRRLGELDRGDPGAARRRHATPTRGRTAASPASGSRRSTAGPRPRTPTSTSAASTSTSRWATRSAGSRSPRWTPEELVGYLVNVSGYPGRPRRRQRAVPRVATASCA